MSTTPRNGASGETLPVGPLKPDLVSPRVSALLDVFGNRGLATPQLLAMAAFFEAFKRLSNQVEATLKPMKLSVPRVELLELLHTSPTGRLSFAELKGATLLRSASLTYTVDNLERRGLIERIPDPADRRSMFAEITPAGRRLAERAIAALNDIRFGFGDINDEDALELMHRLSAVR